MFARCPLTPESRHELGVLCHFRAQCTAAKQVLFDRLAAHRWKCTKDLGGLQINYELNLRSLWIGKLAGFSWRPANAIA
jgi:hypothetical protein